MARISRCTGAGVSGRRGFRINDSPFPFSFSLLKSTLRVEEAITIEGRHESLADFLVHHPAEEVTSYFTEIVAMLEHRGIGN